VKNIFACAFIGIMLFQKELAVNNALVMEEHLDHQLPFQWSA
jgi:hypothetical protein